MAKKTKGTKKKQKRMFTEFLFIKAQTRKTQMSNNRWMDKSVMVCKHNKIPRNKKGKHYWHTEHGWLSKTVCWGKENRQNGCKLYDSIHMKLNLQL